MAVSMRSMCNITFTLIVILFYPAKINLSRKIQMIRIYNKFI